MKFWRFMDYYSEAGNNLIEKWYNDELDEAAQAEFDTTLNILAGTKIWQGLSGFRHVIGKKYGGLWEVRFTTNNVQYRSIGFIGPGDWEFTLLIGCSKKGKVYKPPDAFDTALKRWTLYCQGRGSIREHSI